MVYILGVIKINNAFFKSIAIGGCGTNQTTKRRKSDNSLKRPSSNNVQAMGSGRVTSYVWLTITVINIVSMSPRKSLNNETL